MLDQTNNADRIEALDDEQVGAIAGGFSVVSDAKTVTPMTVISD